MIIVKGNHTNVTILRGHTCLCMFPNDVNDGNVHLDDIAVNLT